MRISKNKNWLLSVISFALLISCASKPPPDVFAFKHLKQQIYVNELGEMKLKPSPTCLKQTGEFECGYGVSIMTGREIYVGNTKEHLFNGKTWDELIEESIFLPSEESYAPLSAHVINSCKALNCSQEVNKFKVKLDKLQKEEQPKEEDLKPKAEDLTKRAATYMIRDHDSD